MKENSETDENYTKIQSYLRDLNSSQETNRYERHKLLKLSQWITSSDN